MAFFDWKEEYSVGIQKLDKQHGRLVEFLNELYAAMHAGEGTSALAKVLNGLVQYTQTHFATEESLMKLYGYPEYASHKAKHDKMAQHVLALVRKFETGEISSPIQITLFLKDWLTKHIMETDKAYAPFLQQKGVH